MGVRARPGTATAQPHGAWLGRPVDIHKGVLLECNGLARLLAAVGGGHGGFAHHLDPGAVPVLAHLLRHVDAAAAERGEAGGALGLGGRAGTGVAGGRPRVGLQAGHRAAADQRHRVHILKHEPGHLGTLQSLLLKIFFYSKIVLSQHSSIVKIFKC